jgi:hypothetical protein
VDDLDQLASTARELTGSIIASSVGYVNATAELDVLDIVERLRDGGDDLLYGVLRALGLTSAFLAQELSNRQGSGTTAEVLQIVQIAVNAISFTESTSDQVRRGPPNSR